MDNEKELVLIINSGKCAWGKCMFCGWGCAERDKKSLRWLKEFLDSRLKRHKGVKWLKIFNSGSFFDEKQIPKGFRSYCVRKCEQLGIANVVVESLPNFITKENLDGMQSKKVRTHVAIGLEVADDNVLKKLDKGIMSKEKYAKAAQVLHDNGLFLRTYLVANPPYVKNVRKSLADSVKFAWKHSDSVAICNLYPHSNSRLFELWASGKWKPLDKKGFDDSTKSLKAECFFDNFIFRPQWKPEKQKKIIGATIKQLKHPYFEVWQDFIARFHKIPKGKDNNKQKDIVLFVPCAFRKPYWASKLHKAIEKVIPKKLKDRIHLVVLSSPGVVPIELCNNYPFNAYDWPEWEETKLVKKEYVKVTQKRVEGYLRGHEYKKYFCYFKPTAESFIALEKACKKLNIPLTVCADEKVFDNVKNVSNALALPEMLDGLVEKLKSI
jgi:archaeosine synthase alpha-subunit